MKFIVEVDVNAEKLFRPVRNKSSLTEDGLPETAGDIIAMLYQEFGGLAESGVAALDILRNRLSLQVKMFTHQPPKAVIGVRMRKPGGCWMKPQVKFLREWPNLPGELSTISSLRNLGIDRVIHFLRYVLTATIGKLMPRTVPTTYWN